MQTTKGHINMCDQSLWFDVVEHIDEAEHYKIVCLCSLPEAHYFLYLTVYKKIYIGQLEVSTISKLKVCCTYFCRRVD